MEELLKNAEEFLESGEDDLVKRRFNAAVSDFFKAIVILADYLIYREIKLMPKNHNERFSLLERYFKDIYRQISRLFKVYIRSYNLRLKREEAVEIKYYADELKRFILHKE